MKENRNKNISKVLFIATKKKKERKKEAIFRLPAIMPTTCRNIIKFIQIFMLI